MAYEGDYLFGSTINFSFSTVSFAAGAPTTLAGTPSLDCYKNTSLTQCTTQPTLIVDFDAVTGMHFASIDTTVDATFYARGNDFHLTVKAGTVGGTSIVGAKIASFSIENRCVNWAKVASPNTAVSLLNTNIASSITVTTATTATTATNLTNAPTAGDFTQAMKATINASSLNTVVSLTNAPTTGDFTQAMKRSINVASLDTVATLTTYTGNTVQTGDSFARIGANGAGLTSVAVAAGGIDTGDITAAELNVIADAVLDRIMSTGTDSGADDTTHRTTRQALRAVRNKVSIAAGTMTVTKEDDATTSWTAAVTTTAGDPISSIDPT